MNRTLGIAGGALAGVTLLGVGIAVGSQVGQQEALVAAADAQGPFSTQDTFLLQSFIRASDQFEKLVPKAQKAKPVGEEMTKQAVVVLNVKRSTDSPELHDAAEAVGQAMLLIGAGITANDGSTVNDGLQQYKIGQEKVEILTNKIAEDQVDKGMVPAPASPVEPAPSAS